METIFFILSIILFISTFGIHSTMAMTNHQPMYMSTPLVVLPVISGFILPLYPWFLITNYHWLIILVGNAAIVLVLAKHLTKVYLVRLTTGVLGKDMLYSFGLACLAFIIGMLIQ